MKIFNELPDIHSLYFVRNGRGGRKDYGGYSPCTAGSKELYEGCTLNNCVGGAWGCAGIYEKDPKETVGFIKSGSYPQNAGTWWNEGQQSKWDMHERGKEAKAGSIICYTHHVAFVNEVKSNGDLVCISSAWGSKNENGFEWVTVTKESGYAWRSVIAGEFQGFIYLVKGGQPSPDFPDVSGVTSDMAIQKMALDVIHGDYGNGFMRERNLYKTIQDRVNAILWSNHAKK